MSTELAIQQLIQRVEALERQLAEKSVEKPEKKEKKEKKEKPEKKEKRKRNPTGYNLFVKETRQDAIDILIGEDDETPNKNAMTQLGKMWKALSDSERGEWNQKAIDIASDPDTSEQED